MSPKAVKITSAVAGALVGAMTSYPYEWNITWSLALWAFIGLALGRFCMERKLAYNAGALYGVCLTLSSLLFRIGMMNSLIEYSLLLLLMCIIGGVNGVAVYLVGMESKKIFKTSLYWVVRAVMTVVWRVRGRYKRLYSPDGE